MAGRASMEDICARILDAHAVEVRAVDDGQDMFVYSTGNRGPGYVMIKGLVGQPSVLKFLTKQLAYRVVEDAEFDFVEGNATGGMVPAWQLRDDISGLLGKDIPYCYLRGSRKTAGHGELITGDRRNPLLSPGMRALVVEELVNYAGTTTNAAEEFRRAGYPVSHAACILSYDHPESNTRLAQKGVSLISLVTLPQLLDTAEATGKLSQETVRSYRSFLADPVGWQLQRGLVVPEDAAKTASERGYVMRKLPPEDAVSMGAPPDKVGEGVIYYVRDAA